MLTESREATHNTPIAVITRPPFVQKEKETHREVSVDVLAQCTECKSVETIQFVNGQLSPTRKYFQLNNRIYHRCYGNAPCKLFINRC